MGYCSAFMDSLLGCCGLLKGSGPTLVKWYAFLGVALSITLSIAAAMDYSNHRTTTLYNWYLALLIETAAMLIGLLLSVLVLRAIPGQGTYDSSAEAKKALVSGVKDPRHFCIERVVGMAMYFSFLSILSVWGLAQILFLYRYTKTEDGVQTGLDGGFPNDDGTWSFTVQRKNDFVWLVQLQGYLSAACLIGYLIRCQAQFTLRTK